jgi:hypothetical protein
VKNRELTGTYYRKNSHSLSSPVYARPPLQLPLSTDEGVHRPAPFTPPTTGDEGVAHTQPPKPKPPLDSDAREPSTLPEGANDNDDNPATFCLEGVTNLNFSKQNSVDETITRCTVVDLLSDSGGSAYAAKLLGPHQHSPRWNATLHCRPTNTNNATTTPTPHVTSSLRLRGSGTKKGKKIATRTPTRGTFDTLDTADDDDEIPDDSSTLHPDIDAAGSSSDHASTSPPSLPVHAPVPTTSLDPSAGTHDPSPTAPDLKDLRAATDAVTAATDAHRTAIYDLGTDLHLLSDEFRQFRSDQRVRDQAHQDATTRTSPYNLNPTPARNPPRTTHRAPNSAPAFASSLKPKERRLMR